MSNKKSEIKFNFKNHLIDYQSNLKGFDEKIFNKIDKKSKDLNLFEKIKELKDGKKVNLTENKSARHMQQREEYSFPNFGLETFADINDPPELYQRDIKWDSSLDNENPRHEIFLENYTISLEQPLHWDIQLQFYFYLQRELQLMN